MPGNVAMDFEKAESMSFEEWTVSESGKYLQRDFDELRHAVFGNDKRPYEGIDVDDAIREIEKMRDFSGRKLTVAAPLGGPYYLVKTEALKWSLIFAVVHVKEIKVVAKFYWDMLLYWNFGQPREDGDTDDVTEFSVTVSRQGTYVIIVGPAEPAHDWSVWKYGSSTKLLRCHSWEIECLQLPIDGWPSHVVFDLRPYQEHIVYMVQSRRNNCHPFKDMTGGTLCQYDVRERKLLRQMSSVICVHCLREGKQLLVMQGKENTEYVHAAVVLDSDTFTPLLQFTNIKPESGDPLHKLSLLLYTAAFHSADFKAISFFTWDRKYKECAAGLTLTSGKTCLTLMTLREVCRAIVLQHLRVQDLGKIPLPEALKAFIRGYPPYCK